MKITLDASQIIYETGVSVYTRNLIRALLKYDKKNTYKILASSFRGYNVVKNKLNEIIKGHENAKTLIFPFPQSFWEFIFNRTNLNIDVIVGKTDIFHSSDWVQPLSKSFNITTIHDLAPIIFPQYTHPKIVHVHKRRLDRVKKFVDKIIVPSQTVKRDLLELGFKENRISVIYEACDMELKRPKKNDVIKIKKKYRINGNYLLAMGHSERKNTQRIIEAFEKLRTSCPLKLVILGKSSNPFFTRNLIFLGHISRDDMIKIFKGASALIYPSLYEGFGLPILEAFYLGVPVLTSNLGSMKEIAGNACCLVNPLDVDDISFGIEKILKNRSYYIKKGRNQLKKFSWGDSAKKTLEIYKSL